MATYKVQPSQNIFDIALGLYGSVEGIYDLLVSNPTLSLSDCLEAGRILEYHPQFKINPSIVSYFEEAGMPANGERKVYPKFTDEPLLAIIEVPVNLDALEFAASGDGYWFIDWGDNSDLERLEFSEHKAYEHYFDNDVEERLVKIYGSASFDTLDMSHIKGRILFLEETKALEIIYKGGAKDISFMSLFVNAEYINLANTVLASLEPLRDLHILELDLRNVKFTDSESFSEYLKYVINNIGGRPGCKVYLDSLPSEESIVYMKTILANKEWNTPHAWEFIVCGQKYLPYSHTNFPYAFPILF